MRQIYINQKLIALCAFLALNYFSSQPGHAQMAAEISGAHGAVNKTSLPIQKIAIFGEDNRKSLPKSYAALDGKIGLLYNDRVQTLCTAFCLAPDVIATAAHCLFGNQKRKRPKIANFSFRINNKKRTSAARIAGFQSGAASHYIVAGTTGLRTRPPMDAPKDWALAKLSAPACKYGVLKLRPQPLPDLIDAASREKIFQVAYHWDYEHWKLAYSGPCGVKHYSGKLNWKEVKRLFSDPSALILHTCDTGGASSGSPILMNSYPEPVVVAMNVGSYEQSK
ncbi:MAG: trypsin-like serine peptidase, partial [Methyloligellaceae bacterium]